MRSKGFTLIELLIVVAIIAILSSVIIVSLNSARERSRDAARISQMRQIQKAIELYIGEHQEPPLLDLLGGNYVNSCGTEDWETLKAEVSPYVTTIPNDPINTNGFCYGYGPALGADVLPANTECQIGQYALFFASEATQYGLPEWEPGSDPPIYCIH